MKVQCAIFENQAGLPQWCSSWVTSLLFRLYWVQFQMCHCRDMVTWRQEQNQLLIQHLF